MNRVAIGWSEWTCTFLSTKRESTNSLLLRQIHLQSCVLAGGVAVGVSMSAIRQPWEAMTIGFTAAVVSTIGFRYLKVLITA